MIGLYDSGGSFLTRLAENKLILLPQKDMNSLKLPFAVGADFRENRFLGVTIDLWSVMCCVLLCFVGKVTSDELEEVLVLRGPNVGFAVPTCGSRVVKFFE